MARFNKGFKSKLYNYVLTHLPNAHPYKHSWVKADCPFCGRTQKFGINISLDRTNCFVCGSHGSVLDLVTELEGLENYSLAKQFIDNGTESNYHYVEEKVTLKEHRAIMLPDGFRNIRLGESTVAKAARSYLISRGFDINTVSRKGWGYGTTGKYFGYIIIPFTAKGELTYFNARLYMGSGPRYNNPDNDVTGLGKSFIWYNHDALYMYKTIFLCEGVFNSVTIGEKAVAAGGKFVSRYQINELIKCPVERVIICLDRDAIDKAVDLALKLVDFKKVKVIKFPEGLDANDLGHKKTMKLIYQSRYLSKLDLNKMKRNI
ncbi:MAG: hypothetical protein RSC49_01015 [Clostridium sp.]